VIRQIVDPDVLRRQMEDIRAQVARGDLDAAVAAGARLLPTGGPDQARQALLAALPTDNTGPPSSGGEVPADGADDVPFIGRDPATAVLQTVMEQRVHAVAPNVIEHAPAAAPAELAAVPSIATWLSDDQFTTWDPRWVTEVAKALAERLAQGNHPFNRTPARCDIKDDARLILVGDWGTGLPRARAVAGFMAEEVADALAAGRTAHVIHLGDVYYSGDPGEYDSRFLADGLWPVTAEQAEAGVTSWSLNGNHDMYSGGWGYFDHLLAEPRFQAQRSPDGRGTSYFRISSPTWDFVGLDTAWDPDPLAMGHVGVLEDPQAAFVAEVAAEGRGLVLLSHHQLASVFDPHDLGKVIPGKLSSVLNRDRVAAWFWGHEHRLMGFDPVAGVKLPRCAGHGGVPVLAHAKDAPIPPPGSWEARDVLEDKGRRWARFGFVVLDLQGDQIEVRYRNELGEVAHAAEVIS
jgi:3',5'-cyclic AMP phosphodiesterase CpdA